MTTAAPPDSAISGAPAPALAPGRALLLVALVACLFFFMGVLELIRSRILVRIGLRIDRLLSGHRVHGAERIFRGVGNLRLRRLHLRVTKPGPWPS